MLTVSAFVQPINTSTVKSVAAVELPIDASTEVRLVTNSQPVQSVAVLENSPSEVSENKSYTKVSPEKVSLPAKAKKVTEHISTNRPARVVSAKVFTVPFYSQFSDISSPSWQKVGCGIASLAMLISYYEDEPVSVNGLLEKGISAGAYLDSAGWIHSGLINLSHEYGLDGESRSLADLSMDDAFTALEKELKAGPVMASVHYTFEPTNPIPHLVVVNGVKDGQVFYNDPAEKVGGGSLSIDKFEKAWKKRYIAIRPIS